ncbi:amidohydrolase family protein [Myxococcota bacterium]|nr:amidohydrolase family protein [Myxococcota bacterium]MBU1432679.1 amidohydrolase family protein [Myxococcota bacterium]MBU1898304.1 amidohydrolase family protein [Myxococcota bacterium]
MPILFQGATLHRPDQPPLPNAAVLIDGPLIRAVGLTGEIHASEAEIIDARGQHLCPGLIDPHTHLGLMPEGFVQESKDLNEMTSPVTPTLRASDGIWPGDVGFARARAGGVTTVGVLPGSANVYGGLGVAVATAGRNVDEMIRRDPAGLKIALGLNVKLSHGVKAGRAPLTRMGVAAILRERMEAALTYEQSRLLKPETPEAPELEILLQALRRELVVRAHAARADDLQAAIRFARRYGLRLVLEHAHQAHLILDEIVAAGAPVVLGPLFKTLGHSEETHLDFEAARALDAAGVRVALMTDHPIIPVGYLSVQAGLCVRAGVPPARALAMITTHAAQILGLEGIIGDVAPGLRADLVRLSGPPLEIASRVLETWIDGRRVYTGASLPVPGAAL